MNNNQKQITDILSQAATGMAIGEIDELLEGVIERRTLQRMLTNLIDQEKVTKHGRGKATTYSATEKGLPKHPVVKKPESGFQLSEEAQKIQAMVMRQAAKRQPVGYNRAFLEEYEPNVSSYLTADEMKHLENVGKTARLNEPAGTYAKEILQRLLIDLAWNSSRMEGNTYSLLDTQRLIKDGVSAEEKSSMEAQMILNHKDAIEFLVNDAEEIGFNYYTITNLHALLSNNLLPNPAASGALRTFGVGITGSVFTPLGIPQVIDEMFYMMLQKASAITNPFEQAFFIMVQLPYLQPFDDVNKRVSRLAANIPLNRFNFAPLSFTDVPTDLYFQGLLGIYELNRTELFKDVFLWAYDRSAKLYAAQRQSLGEPDPFRLEFREPIKLIIRQIMKDAMPKELAISLIKVKASELPKEVQKRFTETVETELINMHKGNFARYMITPKEFEKWREVWNEGK